MKARLLPPRSVAVTPVQAPVVPEAVELQVVGLVPVVVARLAAVEPALVAAVALVPVAVELQVERVVARFPSEQWSKGVPVAAA
ncbi:hypothetical protein C6A86_019410 [Mycobacterium sp. ITM-2016-00316]|uniref:hypothetical protein n=1 Tax=Mycobacterium sp. ITM-2016-00316 TaxID=2099695 RepID=UPI00287F8F95|nr:hypothetical protein [Mycobacterium sp. ITM-2016-00316]WNG80388.1 hypothetical protein C6A86_019410 [Mycobacterium sp. ITM-2016-00316]